MSKDCIASDEMSLRVLVLGMLDIIGAGRARRATALPHEVGGDRDHIVEVEVNVPHNGSKEGVSGG